MYICYIIILNMFRAVICSSSGGQIVLLQFLVSSLSVNGRTVCRLRADCSPKRRCATTSLPAVISEGRVTLVQGSSNMGVWGADSALHRDWSVARCYAVFSTFRKIVVPSSSETSGPKNNTLFYSVTIKLIIPILGFENVIYLKFQSVTLSLLGFCTLPSPKFSCLPSRCCIHLTIQAQWLL